MACITAADSTVFCDGPYSALCSREKTLCDFDGIVQLNDAGCVSANGTCSSCAHPLSALLYVQ